MEEEKSIGQQAIDAIDEILEGRGTLRLARPMVDTQALRKKLHLTQKEFAEQYHLNVDTLKNWEQHRRQPDAGNIAYLTCISKQPDLIRDILNPNG
jgi:putative transcriptional regulator